MDRHYAVCSPSHTGVVRLLGRQELQNGGDQNCLKIGVHSRTRLLLQQRRNPGESLERPACAQHDHVSIGSLRMCCNFQSCRLVTGKNREMIARPAIFKWRQTEPGLILCAVRWYLRYSLSLRDVEGLLEERGLNVDHPTVWRWVQYYGPELEQRLRRHLKPTNKSWRVDETYERLKGRWCY